MQIPLLHQQILLQTEKLRDLHRSIMQHTSPIPSSEMENLLLEIRKLYELALSLNNENALQLLNEIHLAAAAPAAVSIKESQPAAEILQHNTNHIAENSIEKNQAASVVHEKQHETHTVAEKFTDQPTLGDKIAGSDIHKRFSDSLRTPVKDIKAAIGLNEKFQFINQLFNGDAQKYNAFIDELNISPSADIAMNSIQKISDSNNWESHASSAKTFMDIIERRFSA